MADKYLILATEAAAQAASHTAYLAATPNWAPETHKTVYLCGTIRPRNELDLRRALVVAPEHEARFSAAQRAAMVTRAGLNSGDWN